MTDTLSWTSARETRSAIVEGNTSAVAVMEACLARIERLNPILNAFTHIDQQGALNAACQADAALARGLEPGPLHGVPVAIKDDLWVAGMPATCGSLLFARFRPSIDGAVAARLRAAGAIIVGKTTMPEFAAWPRSKSYLGGEAVNPWDTRRIAGASSGGSAAAVASGMVPIAIGTDGGGSTRIPAALTGLVGLHSTLGKVPAHGSFCCSPCQSAGPIARDVKDAALVQQILTSPLPVTGTGVQTEDLLEALEQGIQDLKVGWSPNFGWIPVADAVVATAREAVDLLPALGATVKSMAQRIPHPWGDGSLMAALHDAVTEVGDPPAPATPPPDVSEAEEWLARCAANNELCFTAAEFLSLVGRHHDLLSPPQQCLSRVSLQGSDMPEPQALTTLMDEVFAEYDVICTPTMADVAPIAPPGWASAYRDSFMGTHFTFIANATSLPAITLPCGLVDGLPVGLQVIGPRGSDALVLQVACALEDALPKLPRPAL